MLLGFNIVLLGFLVLTEDTAQVEASERKKNLIERSYLISQMVYNLISEEQITQYELRNQITSALLKLPKPIYSTVIVRPYNVKKPLVDNTPYFNGLAPNLFSEINVSRLPDFDLVKPQNNFKMLDIIGSALFLTQSSFNSRLATPKLQTESARDSLQQHFISNGPDEYEIRVINPVKLNGKTVATIDIVDLYNFKNAYLERNTTRIFSLLAISGLTLIFGVILAFYIALPLQRLSKRLSKTVGKESVSEDLSSFHVRGFKNRKDEVGLLYSNLQILNGRLASLFADKEAFAADVSHELKNPLASIIANLENIPKDTDPEIKSTLGTIGKQASRMNRLISEISDSALVDSELVKTKRESFNFSSLLSEIVVNMQEEAGKAKVTLNSRVTSNVKFIGLPDRIAQVAVNLIQNAISFSPKYSEVLVSLRKSFRGEIELLIEDAGSGISETDKERVFDRFYTNRTGTSVKENSSGLGLFISKQIVEAHNGSITIDKSKRLGGAFFRVKFSR
ncbi:MAG: HAMP domain-containing sensor histidine kinase [Proteobacteria bacterium]|nr:HAMP domain-containing sensor histidine kinase [Pseudomonadota bacterium]